MRLPSANGTTNALSLLGSVEPVGAVVVPGDAKTKVSRLQVICN